jgi:hypothetical protein
MQMMIAAGSLGIGNQMSSTRLVTCSAANVPRTILLRQPPTKNA